MPGLNVSILTNIPNDASLHGAVRSAKTWANVSARLRSLLDRCRGQGSSVEPKEATQLVGIVAFHSSAQSNLVVAQKLLAGARGAGRLGGIRLEG